MQLENFLKVPVVFFFEDYPFYEGTSADSSNNNNKEEDLNYSFLVKLFSNLSEQQKEKIFQVLRNTRILDKKTG